MNYKDIQVKKDFEEEFKDVFTCAKHVRENFIDITLRGVTKGDAITELIEKLGIDKKDTYAFGDADNDVEMVTSIRERRRFSSIFSRLGRMPDTQLLLKEISASVKRRTDWRKL